MKSPGAGQVAFISGESGGSRTQAWRPGPLSRRVLNALGCDSRDFKHASELKDPWLLIAAIVVVSVLAFVVTFAALPVIFPETTMMGRLITPVVVVMVVFFFDLWVAGRHPGLRARSFLVSAEQAPDDDLVPVYPRKSLYFALIPRALISLLLAGALGTLGAIATNAEAVENERRIIALEQLNDLAATADSGYRQDLRSAQEAVDRSRNDYEAALEVEREANLRTKCEAGELAGSYRGVRCVPGGDGLQQAIAVRQDARESLAAARDALDGAQDAERQLRDAGPPSAAAGFASDEATGGIDLTTRAYLALLAEGDDWLSIILLLLPHIVLLAIDLSCVLFKLMQGLGQPERRRWDRMHSELGDDHRGTLVANRAAVAKAEMAMAPDRAIIEAARAGMRREEVEESVRDAMKIQLARRLDSLGVMSDHSETQAPEGTSTPRDQNPVGEAQREAGQQTDGPELAPAAGTEDSRSFFVGAGGSKWIIGPPIAGPGKLGAGVSRSRHPIHIAVRAVEPGSHPRLQPDLDVRVVRLSSRAKAMNDLKMLHDRIVGVRVLRPESSVVRVLAGDRLPTSTAVEPHALVMQYFPRSDARRYWVAAEGPGHKVLMFRTVADVAVALIDALVPNWSRGLVHGDMKLAHVIVGGRMPGLPYERNEADPTSQATMLLTADWEVAGTEGSPLPLGTYSYMAPELATAPVRSVAADSFAVGSCLFELMTGRTPNNIALGRSEHDELLLDSAWPAVFSEVWRTLLVRAMPRTTPHELRDLVMDLIHPNPAARLRGDTPERRGILEVRLQRVVSASRTAGLVGPYALDTSSLPPSPGWARFREFFAEVGYAMGDDAERDGTRRFSEDKLGLDD